MKQKVDSTDYKILKILSEQGKIQNVDLAKKIYIAPSAALNRVKKLEKNGIIQSYHAKLNDEALDRSFVTFISVKTNGQSTAKKIGAELSKIQEIQEVFQTAGEYCFLIKLRTRGSKELGQLLNDKISSVPGIGGTSTIIALSTFKENSFFDF